VADAEGGVKGSGYFALGVRVDTDDRGKDAAPKVAHIQ
jgi:hypothetical protein